MSDGNNLPIFGRRRVETFGVTQSPVAPAAPAGAPAGGVAEARFSGDNTVTTRPEVAELRNLCLARMDATAVASLAPERLLNEVERLISDLATDKRVQMNAREQRALATELVDDMLGLGPLEPLLADDAITDIMVNGPDQVFVERRGKLTLTPVRFRDLAHVANVAPAHRRRGRPARRRNAARCATRASPTAAASTSCSRRWP